MDQSDIDDVLQQSLTGGKLSRAEKSVLGEILTSGPGTEHQRDLMRNRAIEIARQSLLGPDAKESDRMAERRRGRAVGGRTCLKKQFRNR